MGVLLGPRLPQVELNPIMTERTLCVALSSAGFGFPQMACSLVMGKVSLGSSREGHLEGSLSVTLGLTETGVFEDVNFDIPNSRAVRERDWVGCRGTAGEETNIYRVLHQHKPFGTLISK